MLRFKARLDTIQVWVGRLADENLQDECLI